MGLPCETARTSASLRTPCELTAHTLERAPEPCAGIADAGLGSKNNVNTTTPTTIVLDDAAYRAAARSFLQKFARPLVAACKRQGLVLPGPGGVLSAPELGRIFDIGFVLLATLEDRNGFVHQGDTTFASVVFSARLPPEVMPLSYIGSAERTALHGMLDDDVLQEAATAESTTP